jgi:DNA recombination protein RmuC
MTNLAVILAAIAGALLGGVFAALLARSRIAALDERRNSLEQELATARNAVEQQASEIKLLSAARAALDATLATERRNAEEKLRLLAEASEQLKTEFKALAAAALESNNSNFLQLAQTTLQNYQTHATGELAQKEQAVKNLVDPIAQSLIEMSQQIRDLEQARSQAYGTLTTQVASLLDTQKALQAETGNLVKALREPQARGRWGELQLRRVLELAGMLEHCDFQEQESISNDERRFRPDVIVNLPGDKQIVVDSKAPLAAYLAALDAPDEATRTARLADHARQIRQHIDALGGKAYWAQLTCTPEFVVLFLPGEVFFRAAMDSDAELIEYGVSRKVIVASPTTLIALLKAVAYGWNQKNLAESAGKICDAGKDLYKRLCTMAGHMHEMGKKIGGTVTAYNDMLRSMESRVFPLARKFPDLDRSLPVAALPELDQLDKAPFELQAPDWHEGNEEESGLPVTSDGAADSAKV